jgi:anthranilate synthase component I
LIHLHCEAVTAPDFLALAAAKPARYFALLESSALGLSEHAEQASWDFLCVSAERAELDFSADTASVAALKKLDQLQSGSLGTDSEINDSDINNRVGDLPFRCGWLVYLSYEMAAACEPSLQLPASEMPGPALLCARVPVVLARRKIREREQCFLVWEAGFADLANAVRIDLAQPHAAPKARAEHCEVSEDAPERFLDGVTAVQRYLHAGDVFQVNLSRAWRATYAAPVAITQLYANLRAANPAPFSALVQHAELGLISSSPERLVRKRGNVVETRPIAGTRARVNGENLSAQDRANFAGDLKERAEHIMLIDLERNDLGRVCEAGSVEVDEILQIESYAHVHHLVSNVRGRLRSGISPSDLLRAVFPGGTITGCPKVRCMQIIAELEGVGRGAYTGSLGYISHGGDVDFNILIRTITHQDRSSYLRAGAGIVVDSIAEKELNETRAKARGMLRALGAEN